VNILNTFDSLIPGAYKADLWRYCVLYINGGIYLDIKYSSFNNFKFINLTEKEHFVLDIDGYSVYNALLVCLPRNEKLLNAINKIVFNVKNKNYGINSLHPTGPRLLGDIISYDEKKLFDMYHKCNKNKLIFLNGYVVLKSYNGYESDQNNNAKTSHYSSLWASKRIYRGG
jgi:mannosyltransferase OCH1-like enzyme